MKLAHFIATIAYYLFLIILILMILSGFIRAVTEQNRKLRNQYLIFLSIILILISIIILMIISRYGGR